MLFLEPVDKGFSLGIKFIGRYIIQGALNGINYLVL